MEGLTVPPQLRILRGNITVSVLEKGGSDRYFFRVRDHYGATAIVMRYSPDKQENALFVPIAQMLRAEGFTVPEIFFHDPARHEVWMEDLGECDLCALVDANGQVQQAAYASALSEVARLHALDPQQCLARHPNVRLMPAFDETLYRWEQEYFLTYAVGRIFGIELQEPNKAMLMEEFTELRRKLLPGSRNFIHRDFQSQNVLWHLGRAWLVDFQGMRVGHPLYDVASLLFDPYVQLSSAKRSQLLELYVQAAEQAGVAAVAQWCQRGHLELLLTCSGVQRLLQALGAYGFLSTVRGKRRYLDYVVPALATLSQLLQTVDFLPQLRCLVDQLLSRAVK